MKEVLKKIGAFAILCFWVLGLVGGVGFALAGGSVPCAVGCAVLGVLSFPTIKRAFLYLQS